MKLFATIALLLSLGCSSGSMLAQSSSGGSHAETGGANLLTHSALRSAKPSRAAFLDTASRAGPLEILHWSAASADAAQTCLVLSQPHTHEDFLPTQHCAPVVGMIIGQTALEEFVEHKLEKKHKRWSRVVRLYGVGDSLFAIAYSVAKGAL